MVRLKQQAPLCRFPDAIIQTDCEECTQALCLLFAADRAARTLDACENARNEGKGMNLSDPKTYDPWLDSGTEPIRDAGLEPCLNHAEDSFRSPRARILVVPPRGLGHGQCSCAVGCAPPI